MAAPGHMGPSTSPFNGQPSSHRLKNDSTVIAWGNGYSGVNNLPVLFDVHAIAAGFNHALALTYSPVLDYVIEPSRDMLLIYNTNSTDSAVVKDYYLAHRPMAAKANVLGVGCPVGESMGTNDFVNQMYAPVLNWLIVNPTKHPGYIILFLDIPSRLTNGVYPAFT